MGRGMRAEMKARDKASNNTKNKARNGARMKGEIKQNNERKMFLTVAMFHTVPSPNCSNEYPIKFGIATSSN